MIFCSGWFMRGGRRPTNSEPRYSLAAPSVRTPSPRRRVPWSSPVKRSRACRLARFGTQRRSRLRCGAAVRLSQAPRCETMPEVNERIERPAVAERQFRDALAQFATGVTIITARAQHGFIGSTANSFNSVSLDPPLVIWSLARRSRSLAIFEGATQYVVNVLAHDQVELARRFSRPHTDRFAGVAFRLGQADAPLIEGCAAWLECRHHALPPAGDHMLFIGEVVAAAHRRLSPLVWHGSRYRVSPPDPEGRDG